MPYLTIDETMFALGATVRNEFEPVAFKRTIAQALEAMLCESCECGRLAIVGVPNYDPRTGAPRWQYMCLIHLRARLA